MPVAHSDLIIENMHGARGDKFLSEQLRAFRKDIADTIRHIRKVESLQEAERQHHTITLTMDEYLERLKKVRDQELKKPISSNLIKPIDRLIQEIEASKPKINQALQQKANKILMAQFSSPSSIFARKREQAGFWSGLFNRIGSYFASWFKSADKVDHRARNSIVPGRSRPFAKNHRTVSPKAYNAMNMLATAPAAVDHKGLKSGQVNTPGAQIKPQDMSTTTPAAPPESPSAYHTILPILPESDKDLGLEFSPGSHSTVSMPDRREDEEGESLR